MKTIFIVLLSAIVVGCSSNMYHPHYQIHNPPTGKLTTTPTTPTPALGDNQAIVDARLHAQQDYQSGTGACLGAGCGLFGIAGSYLYEGQIPIERLQALDLQGKSPTYQLLYKQEYVKEAKRLRTKESVVGYVAALAAFAFLFIIVAAASETR